MNLQGLRTKCYTEYDHIQVSLYAYAHAKSGTVVLEEKTSKRKQIIFSSVKAQCAFLVLEAPFDYKKIYLSLENFNKLFSSYSNQLIYKILHYLIVSLFFFTPHIFLSIFFPHN